MRLIIKEIYVFILIIGKISEENPSYIIILKTNAISGDQGLL